MLDSSGILIVVPIFLDAEFRDEFIAFPLEGYRDIFRPVAHSPRRIPRPDFVGADIFHNQTARLDDRAVADRHPGHDVGVACDQAVAADNDRLRDKRRGAPVEVRPDNDVVAVADHAILGDRRTWADLDKLCRLDDTVVAATRPIPERNLAVAFGPQDRVIPYPAVVAEFHVTIHHYIRARETAPLADLRKLTGKSPRIPFSPDTAHNPLHIVLTRNNGAF